MNIGFVTWWSFNLVMGGLERVATELGKALIERGHHGCFVSFEKYYDSPDWMDLLILPSSHKPGCAANYKALRDFFVQNRVEVIVCHNAYRGSVGQLLHRIAQEIGAKLVFVLHTTPDYFLKKSAPPGPAGTAVRAIRYRKRRRLWRRLYDECDAFVLLSDRYRDLFVEIAGLTDDSKLHAIANANRYPSHTAVDPSVKERVVLYVGRLSEEKGITDLVRVWQQVSPAHPDWRIAFVGDGPCRRVLEQADLPRCAIEGIQDPERYYTTARILVMASKYEGWGMTVTEAMQHAVVPVIYDSYGAAEEILDKGRAGSLITPGDREALARELDRLMSDEESLRSMSRHAAEYVHRFDLDRIATEWEQLLSELLR